jgi:hypothetical protein
MAKVKFPLMSGEARGQFGKMMIHRKGGVVTRMFVPRNPNSAAQAAQRELFRRHYVTGLTQAQADLLYSAILHQHDDFYSLLGHEHESLYVLGSHGTGGVVAAGATSYMGPYKQGVVAGHYTGYFPKAGIVEQLFITTGSAQPGTGSLVLTLMVNTIATALAITIPAGAAAADWVLSGEALVLSAGSKISWRLVNNATGNSGLIYTVGNTIRLATI